jgi:hypothetical protein
MTIRSGQAYVKRRARAQHLPPRGEMQAFLDGSTKEVVVTTEKQNVRPRIARIWRGRTPRAKADAYAQYHHEHGFLPLAKKALAVQVFREEREHETEFMTISWWESREAMSRFTGSDPTRIHHLERDAEFLVELPKSVQILEIIDSTES